MADIYTILQKIPQHRYYSIISLFMSQGISYVNIARYHRLQINTEGISEEKKNLHNASLQGHYKAAFICGTITLLTSVLTWRLFQQSHYYLRIILGFSAIEALLGYMRVVKSPLLKGSKKQQDMVLHIIQTALFVWYDSSYVPHQYMALIILLNSLFIALKEKLLWCKHHPDIFLLYCDYISLVPSDKGQSNAYVSGASLACVCEILVTIEWSIYSEFTDCDMEQFFTYYKNNVELLSQDKYYGLIIAMIGTSCIILGARILYFYHLVVLDDGYAAAIFQVVLPGIIVGILNAFEQAVPELHIEGT